MLLGLYFNSFLGFVKGNSTAWCNKKQLAWKDDISQSKSLSWVKYNTIATNYQLDNRSANKGNSNVVGNFIADHCIIRLKTDNYIIYRKTLR